MPADENRADDSAAFVITRRFKLPRAVVWKAWSEAGQLQRWWGPKGCFIDVHRFEFRPGRLLSLRNEH